MTARTNTPPVYVVERQTCPLCGAEPGWRCENVPAGGRGRYPRPESSGRVPHWARMRVAAIAREDFGDR